MSDTHISIEMPAYHAAVECSVDECSFGVKRVTVWPGIPDDADLDDIDLPDCPECGDGEVSQNGFGPFGPRYECDNGDCNWMFDKAL